MDGGEIQRNKESRRKKNPIEDTEIRRRVEVLNEDQDQGKIQKKEAKDGRPKNFLFGECGGVWLILGLINV